MITSNRSAETKIYLNIAIKIFNINDLRQWYFSHDSVVISLSKKMHKSPMWVLNCIQNLDWQGLQMSLENNIHWKKIWYEDDFCFQFNDTPGIKLFLLLGTTVKLDKIQRKKKIAIWSYQRVSKEKRTWGAQILERENMHWGEPSTLYCLSPKVFTDS